MEGEQEKDVDSSDQVMTEIQVLRDLLLARAAGVIDVGCDHVREEVGYRDAFAYKNRQKRK